MATKLILIWFRMNVDYSFIGHEFIAGYYDRIVKVFFKFYFSCSIILILSDNQISSGLEHLVAVGLHSLQFSQNLL
jgi:hypothetical protein